jgi:hypothetical protein
VTAEFHDFDASVEVVDVVEAGRVRERFLDAFIDEDAPRFDETIRRRVAFSDGMAYTGYLWDFIKGRVLIDEVDLWERVDRRGWVYVMWDVHSSDRILIDDYWRYPKESVLIGRPPAVIEAGQRFLPEDLYLFDDSFAWVAAVTHDEIDGRRFCLWAGGAFLT